MKQHDDVFAALGNPVRRKILETLIEGPMTAGAIASKFALSRSAVSEHLSILRRARLLSERQSGRERIYSLNIAPMQSVKSWLLPFEIYWRDHLAKLASILEDKDQ